MSIKIPVQADFDPSKIEQQLAQFQQRLNALGQQIAQANKVKFNPVGKTTLQDLQKVTQQFNALLRVSGDLSKRVNATGQKGAGFFDLDWSKLYPDQGSRARQMSKAFQYVTGLGFQAPPGAAPGSPGGGGGGRKPPPVRPGDGSVGGAGMQVVNAGLGAMGPAGGVVSRALNTGMSSGFGAGMMGLLGGMAALGVSKAVGAIMDRIEQAEGNAVAYDRLKRAMGDVTVSFGALKSAVVGTANRNNLTYSETAGLAQQFVKAGNINGAGLGGLSGELGMGIGLSRGFGLDPSAGVGVLGMMRGLGVTKSEQDTRRFALLIGETIGKSGAFAKADEVMDAIAGYAQMQTRSGMGAANVSGYAGMLSGLVGSGIPGLDPAGAGSLLARVNAALTAGGAKGEASQFFSAVVGNRMGLDPLQMQVLREGGAFATNNEAFGKGSVAARYGLSGPSGDTTFLQGTLSALRGAYGNNKGLLAQATANHLGVNMRQAMALLSVQPNQMGEMSKYADLTKLSGSGISNLSSALYGSASDRQAVANSLARRTGADALSPEEMKRLDAAMQGGSESDQRRVLAELVATRDQERTQGSDIRDSKNALDNIKTALADKLIPLTQEIRAGIIYMAGGKERLTTEQIMKAVIENDSRGRADAIKGQFDPQLQDLRLKRQMVATAIEQRSETRLTGSAAYLGKPELVAQKRAERQALERDLSETEKKIAALSEEKAKLLEKENARREQEIKDMEKAAEQRREQEDLAKQAEENRQKLLKDGTPEGPGRYSGGGGKGSVDTSAIDAKLAAAEAKAGLPRGLLKAVVSQEIGGRPDLLADPTKYHYAPDASGRRKSSAFGPFGILESTGRSPGYGVSPLAGKDIDEQIRFASEYLAARIKSAGGVRAGLSGYGEGPGYADSVMRRMRSGTQMPDDAALEARRETERARGMSLRVTADPLRVVHETPDGRPYKQSELLQTRVGGYMQQFRQG